MGNPDWIVSELTQRGGWLRCAFYFAPIRVCSVIFKGIVMQKIGTQKGNIQWKHDVLLGMVCVLVIGIFVWSAEPGFLELTSLQPKDTYYNLLVRGFRAGQLNVA